MIRDSIGPAASEEATKRFINTAKIDRIGIRFLALRLQRPSNLAGRKSSGELLLNLSNGRTCDRAVCHNFMTIDRISPSKVGSMPRKPSIGAWSVVPRLSIPTDLVAASNYRTTNLARMLKQARGAWRNTPERHTENPVRERTTNNSTRTTQNSTRPARTPRKTGGEATMNGVREGANPSGGFNGRAGCSGIAQRQLNEKHRLDRSPPAPVPHL